MAAIQKGEDRYALRNGLTYISQFQFNWMRTGITPLQLSEVLSLLIEPVSIMKNPSSLMEVKHIHSH